MTITEIEQHLPNGFHDSYLQKIDIDYEKREVRLTIWLDVGAPDEPQVPKDSTRRGVLMLSGLLYFVMEPPDSLSRYQEAKALWISGIGEVTAATLSGKLPAPLPPGTFANYFFINDWNSFIIVAATDARFDWD